MISACACFPLHPSKTGLVESDAFNLLYLSDPGSFCLLSVGSYGGRTSRTPYAVESSHSTSLQEVSQGPGVISSSRLEVIKRLNHKAGFSEVIAEAVALNLQDPQHVFTRESGVAEGISPCKATVLQLAEFFLYQQRELKPSVPVVKGYQVALNHVFSLAGMDLTANEIISRMLSSFKKIYLPGEVKPLEWNLSLVLRSLTYPPYKPLRLSSDKRPSQKTCFLLGLTSAKRVNELYGLSYLEVMHFFFCF